MRRGTKRERHLAHFKETGQMTPWLEKRLVWDGKMREKLFDDMYNRPSFFDWSTWYTWIPGRPGAVDINGISIPGDAE